MSYVLRKSRVDSSLFEVFEGESVVREIPVSFSLYRWPRTFASLQEVERWLEGEERRLLKQAAFRLLNAKSQTTSELRKKLLRRGFSQTATGETIEELQRLGFLNDGDSCDAQIRKTLRRGYGPLYIEMKLRSLGLDSSRVRQEITDEMQQDAIRKLLPKLKNPAAALQRRGFDLHVILSVLKNF